MGYLKEISKPLSFSGLLVGLLMINEATTNLEAENQWKLVVVTV